MHMLCISALRRLHEGVRHESNFATSVRITVVQRRNEGKQGSADPVSAYGWYTIGYRGEGFAKAIEECEHA